ncbi:MAG: cation:proton antiporter domain-containing protein [Tissierella sp.]|uniref:cation:proton antiporter domain-containing protein n=1 Tax=Tissierella sp. TaxID=41274 RepID=UPI003F982168
MAFSLGIIIILGLIFNKLFEKIKLPGLLGLLILGILMGPYGMDLLGEDMLSASGDLRKIALIVILLRAGLGIRREDLKKNGISAFKMSFIPGVIEGFTIAFISIKLLGFTFIQGGILGFIIAAVSPAVVVPSMLKMINKGLGKEKGVPTLIVAGASIDDVFAITIFGVFLSLYSGERLLEK